MHIDNDTRGWIMSCVSGIACVLGSGIICIDVAVRQISGKKDFQLLDSNAFLSASLSLSAGVMLFSSLYSMLPSSLNYLKQAGFAPQPAAFLLIGMFLLGVVGIQIISGLIHHAMPSHVVDCAHTHEEDERDLENGFSDEGRRKASLSKGTDDGGDEDTPLLGDSTLERLSTGHSTFSDTIGATGIAQETRNIAAARKPALREQLTKPITFLVGGSKAACDESGPCYGFSQACGQECKKTIGRKDSTIAPELPHVEVRQPVLPRHQSIAVQLEPGADGETHPHHPRPEREPLNRNQSLPCQASSCQPQIPETPDHPCHHSHSHSPSRPLSPSSISTPIAKPTHPHQTQQHHHHVPQNAFLSIGLQTSLAIALHKIPEGFITYATNHVNPTLGLSIFLAIAIHNVTEGFAMALPLYLALNSRFKAMVWSSLLGGISQPAGAGIAALWIWGTGRGYPTDNGGAETGESSYGIYGGMFAATAGVMTSVALQLFSEGLSLTHRRALCIGFAVAGMGVLGVSNALTA
ncbi:hypothetical protein FQN54_000784 [Arachnomyces sp. PD_36]|nr:hypothetical protein FQN54_000784 [Arachnomyces sp. PD_36]